MRGGAALPAKLVRPRQAGAYRRTRLFALLDRACPVAWVSGPPGAGKTTLVASYVEARRLRPIWYQVDEGDADVATLFHYLRQAAIHAAPRKHWRLPLLTPEYVPGLTTFARRWFEELFAGLPDDSVLVLDNYQAVSADSSFHEVVSIALDTLPEKARTILVSRGDPPAPLARLRAGSRMRVLEWEALKLTSAETAGIAHKRTSRRISAEQVRALHSAADGWAAGLVLMLEREGSKDTAARAQRPQPLQAIFDYFASEILERRDAEARQVLLETALLPKVTPALAEALTGCPRAGEILADLARRRYFTDCLPDPEPTYEYHPLFHQFLRARAGQQLPVAYQQELRRRAATLLEQDGQIEHAADLLREARDTEGLGRLVIANAPAYFATGRASTLNAWLAAVAPAVFQTMPWLQYWRAACQLPVSTEAAVASATLAYEEFAAQRDVAGMMAAACLAADAIMYEWGTFSSLDRWIAALEQLLRPGSAAVPEHLRAQAIASLFASLLWRRPDHPEMPAWAERAETCFRQAPNGDFRSRVGLSVGWYFMLIGNFAKAEAIREELERSATTAETSPLARLWTMGLEMQLGWLNADSRRCLEAISRAQSLADVSGVHILDMLFLIARTFAQLIAGDLDGARESLDELRRGTQPTQVLRFAEYHYLESWLAILRGDVPTAHAHALTAEATATQAGMYFCIIIVRLALAQTLYERGDRSAARKYLLDAFNRARGMATRHLEYQCLLVEADFAFRDGNDVSGEKSLRTAFDLGRRHGFVAGGWWRRDLVARLCTRALANGIEVEYARRLVRALHLTPDAGEPLPDAWPWLVRVRALGRFHLELENRPATFEKGSQRKPLALLKALVAAGGSVPEREVADALWPDADGDAAHQTLAVTLHRLRKLLRDERAIRRQDGKLEMDPAHVWTDVAGVERCLDRLGAAIGKECVRLLDAAMRLYRGPLLPGDDEPWIVARRQRIWARLQHAISNVARTLEQAQEVDRAVECYVKALELDDRDEEIHRALIALYQRLGRHAEATAAYERCRAALAATFRVAPSPETQALLASGELRSATVTQR